MTARPAPFSDALEPFLSERLAAHGVTLGGDRSAFADALARFQRGAGLDATGALDAETWTALLEAPGARTAPLSFSASPDGGSDPTEALPGEAQVRLAALGYVVAERGAGLATALGQFQDRILIAASGVLDEETLWALRCATADLGPLIAFAPEWSLEDSGAPLMFGLESRDVEGDGGYVYRQYSDGAVQILRSPQGTKSAASLRSGPAWAAITAEIGRWPEPAWTSLRIGAVGEVVRDCQRRLKAVGCAITGVDGEFGPETEAAVRELQGRLGLPVTGEIDARTRAVLLESGTVAAPARALEAERDRLRALIEPGLGALPPEAQDRVRSVLLEAIRWCGLREIPKGSNGGPEIGAITAGVVAAGQPLPPWCALAVSHWLKAGPGVARWQDTPLGFRNAAALAFGRWGEERGCLLPASGPAPTGSIFVMYRSGSGSDDGGKRASSAARWEGLGHTGLVLQDLGDAVLTLDGNISDMCWTARRPKAGLLGFVSWWSADLQRGRER